MFLEHFWLECDLYSIGFYSASRMISALNFAAVLISKLDCNLTDQESTKLFTVF